MNKKIWAFHQHILKVHTWLIKPEVSIWCGAQLTEQPSTVFHMKRYKKRVNYISARFIMRFWEYIKKRLNKSGRMKTMKKKATAGFELIAVGELLTGGLVMMEKLTETSSPHISLKKSLTTLTRVWP